MESSLLHNRNFRLHWAGVASAQVGSYFTAVALPWLALKSGNDDPLVVTQLLATAALPNGFFILAGGGLADRFSPLRVLRSSRSAFVVVMVSLAVFTWMSVVPPWLLYGYAAVLGTLAAVALPASQALLPALVEASELGAANGIVMGTMHVAQLIAPAFAGWLIWTCRGFGGGLEGNPSEASLAAALLVDAGWVVVATLLTFRMTASVQPSVRVRVLPLLVDGARFCWRNPGIRLVLAYIALVSFFLQGPLLVGLPLFTRFSLGLYERALGGLYAAMGAGTLLGIGTALVARPSASSLGAVVLSCDLAIGISLFGLGWVTNAWVAGALLLAMGSGLGVTMVAGTTWFQSRAPREYLGRIMSLMMFAVQGLVPISATLTGYFVSSSSVGRVMSGAGLTIVLVAALGLALPRVRQMGNLPSFEADIRLVLPSDAS